MDQNESFFVRHRASIIIIVVILFLAAGLLIWSSILKNAGKNPNQSKSTLTPAQIQAIVSDVPTGPETLSPTRKDKILKATSGPETLSSEQRQQILNDNPK
jgi:hypothetical protein